MERDAMKRAVPSSSNDELGMLRGAIKLLLLVVFLGTIMMWIMMPTNTYRQKWQISIRAKANNSIYGTQGATLLIYTFPVLFIAALGCVYLHLAKKKNDNHSVESKNQSLAAWKQPVLVKGPLGIVSWIEIAFLIMFIALLVWTFSTYLTNSFKTITPKTAAKKGEEVWESKLDSAALRLGLVGNVCLAFLFFPVARGSSVLPLLGLTSEGSIKYHIWLGHMVMTLFTVHGICYIIYWAATHELSEMLTWEKTGVSNVAGEISLLGGLVLWVATFPQVRRKFFELFFYAHLFYAIFMIFFIFHVGISYSCIMLPGFYLFLVDRYLRFLQSRRRVRLVSARVLPGETLELNFSKSPMLKYNPTSTVFINVPVLSKLQWHPFTISSNSNLEPEKLSVVIKGEGSWTKKLYQMLSAPSSIDRLEVSVEGPYGPVSSHFLSHDALVMVSGGSGVTPFISIIRELIFTSVVSKCKIPELLLISSFKNSSDLTMLDLILPISGSPADISNLPLRIEAFVTRENGPKTDSSKLNIRSLWFKPHSTDAPISAILGPNSWMWLGAIIASSFVIFLLLIGLITRYYIYPIDHNTNKIFSTALRAFLNMLVICICISITASFAVLWNKKRNAKEAIQVLNMEGATPATSPFAGSYNAERELESLPYQSLAQAINVHYGQRPDLKRLLSECKGSSVGVLACGPKKLRHDVAGICSSGLGANLHFESISFNW